MPSYTFPPPIGYCDSPDWRGKGFLVAEVSIPLLAYSENFAGWSDNLTALHEEISGDNHPIDLASRQDAISQVQKCNLSDDAVIMEIGCSSGFLIRDLANFFPNALIIGADVVKEPLYRLAESIPTVPLLRFDLLKCPLPDASIDILIMLNVLEHIEDDLGALRKAFQLLKPGGRLIIEVPAGPSLFDDYDLQLQHFRRYSASGLKNKIANVGFCICRQSHLGAILFPAFAIVKYFNKFFPRANSESIVKSNASKTRNSLLINLAMKLESKHLQWASLPFGIRVLVTAQKPR